MNTLTEQQQRALDTAGDSPARITESDSVYVLLRSEDFDRIRLLIDDIANVVRQTDPRTQQRYALVPIERYERFKAFFEDDPITSEERRLLLKEFGKRGGWDDPDMDIYDQVYGEQR